MYEFTCFHVIDMMEYDYCHCYADVFKIIDIDQSKILRLWQHYISIGNDINRSLLKSCLLITSSHDWFVAVTARYNQAMRTRVIVVVLNATDGSGF